MTTYTVRSKHIYDYAYREQSTYPDATFDTVDDAIDHAIRSGESDARRDWGVFAGSERNFIGTFSDGVWRFRRGAP